MESKQDELNVNIQDLQDTFMEDVDILWREVFEPYLKNNHTKQILQKLDLYDSCKFHNFLLTKSKLFKK
ncbi:MAG: hypothetical protein CMF62_03030 [Magnetococcales bacterium]|nr:hypothetical protein [Magnetococcales bacterium]|tara:strand:+ start:19397 stop:19603 length:207 start_codon:yes stop_codon:yes gene_type:complete